MRTFAQKPKTTQPTASTESLTLSRTGIRRSHDPNSIHNLQRTIGNQAVQQMLEAEKENVKGHYSGPTGITRLGHDFSRIPIHPPSTGAIIQSRVEPSSSEDKYETRLTELPGR